MLLQYNVNWPLACWPLTHLAIDDHTLTQMEDTRWLEKAPGWKLVYISVTHNLNAATIQGCMHAM